MTDARIPTPRRIARTPVIRQPSAATLIGGALEGLGAAGEQFMARREATDEQVREIEHRIAMDEQRRQDDALFIEKAAEWAAIEEQARLRASELRSEGSYRDHPQRVQQELDARFREFDESLVGNERVRQRFRLGIVQSAARIDAQEQEWARQQGFKVQGEAVEATANTRANQLSRAKPEEIRTLSAQFAKEGDELLAAGTFNDEQQGIAGRAYRTKLAEGAIEGLFNAGKPDVVQAMIDRGELDGLDLDVSKVAAQVAGERRALDLAEQRRQTEALANARAEADAIEAKIRNGINPTPEEFAAVNSALAAAGAPEAERIDFGALTVQMGLNRQYSDARDPDGIAAAQSAASLRAKVDAGTATEAEQVAAAHLTEVANARAKAAGARLKDMAGQGVQGQMAVLADLDRLPPDQRAIAAEQAMPGLGHVAGLQGRTREFALEGRVQRKARPADFGTKAEVEAAFRDAAGDFAGMLAGNYPGMMETAWDIYAATLAVRGRTGWEPATFAASVSQAFGRTVRAESGEYQGGIGTFGRHRVILPAYQTGEEFERAVRSLTFAKARYRDGSKVAREDVLSSYRPEYYRDDASGLAVYRMIDASGRPLMKEGGGFYDFAAPRPARRR